MLRSWIATFIAVVFVAVAVVAGIPSVAKAEMPSDYPIRDGHFFTQASNGPGETLGAGYSVTNGDGIPFWDAYQSFGGLDELGYPISKRFFWDGQVCQVTEYAVLQWNASANQVQLVNVFDELNRAGKDDWLNQTKRIPLMVVYQEGAKNSYEDICKFYLSLLNDAPITRSFYNASASRQIMYGLPKSKAEEYGVCYTVRFQRVALHVWQQAVEGHRLGEITLAPVGQIVKEAELFDASIFVPEYSAPDPEASTRVQRVVSSRGDSRILTGRATWYGAYFHGRVMRNGEIFDMYNPTTTASNVFPLESKLRVTSTITGSSVIVRVTDTGGFQYPILVDLSWAAFNQIADPGSGTVPVTVERIE